MKKKLFIFVTTFILSTYMVAQEYMYPVAHREGEELFYLYQSENGGLELFSWNTKTDTMNKLLSSSLFFAAGFQLLPNGAGFSFIDNDRIRIKQFCKRSPKSIAVAEPLYNFETMTWIDENHFCVSAKKGNTVGIFEVCVDDGAAQEKLYKPGFSYRFPQKKEQQLFCIQESKDEQVWSIVECDYDRCYPTTEIMMSSQFILFLHMISDVAGIYVQYSKPASTNNVLFSCHYIYSGDTVWRKRFLFDYEIPLNLLSSGSYGLYESYIPFMPRYIDGSLYVFGLNNNAFDLYQYVIEGEGKKKKLFDFGETVCFSPLVYNGRLFYGAALQENAKKMFNPLNFSVSL